MVLSPFVSHCTPSCFPLLDGVSTFSGVLSPTGWCSRLPKGLVSLCLPLYPFLFAPCWMVCLPSRERVLSPTVPLLVSLCWMVSPPSAGSCLPLSPIVPLLVLQTVCCSGFSSCSLCSMVCPLPEGLVSLCLPLYPFLFPFVGWCVRLPGGLVSPCLPLSPFLFPFVGWCVRRFECLSLLLPPFLFPFVKLLDGMSALPRSCLPLSPLVFLLCPHSRGLVSPGLPSCFLLLDGASAFVISYLPVSPIVSPHVCLCWMVCPPSRGSWLPLSPIEPLLAVSLCWMVCPPSAGSCRCLSPIVPLLVLQTVYC